MKTVEQKISRGVVFQFFSFGVAGLVQVMFIPFIINKLGKTQYGIYEIALSLTLLNALLEIGVGSTITNYIKQYFDEDKAEYRSFFWTFFWFKLLISLLIFLACIIVALNAEIIYKKVPSASIPELKQSIIWFAIGAIITNLVSFFDNVQTGFIRYDFNSITNISSKLFFIIAFFYWIYFWKNVTIAQFCLIVFVFVPLFRLFHQIIIIGTKQREIITRPEPLRLSYIKSKLSYLGGFSLITFISQLYKYGITFILGLVSAPTIVGEFGIITKIVDLVNGISDMLIRPIMPAAKDLLKKYSSSNIIYTMTNIHSLVVIGLSVIIIINSPLLSKYFLQGKYEHFQTHLSIMVLPRLFPSYIVLLMLYYASGKTRLNIHNKIRKLILVLSFSYVGFKLFGFSGLIVSFSISTILAEFINLNYFLKEFKEIDQANFYKVYLKKWVAASLVLVGFMLLMLSGQINDLWSIGINIFAIIIFYFLLKQEIMQLIQRYKERA